MNPFEHVKRKRFTAQERAKVFASCNGTCHRCRRKLSARDDWTLEHLIALENGGTNEALNLTVTCEWCEPEKTAEDHEQAGHARRSYTHHVVPKRFQRSRGWKL
jgi:5-methylcytosine-specific restriction enzyme A